MKYFVLLTDGAGDNPIEKLHFRTPLEVASKPTMDFLAAGGEVGNVCTIPDGMSAGSEVANLSVMGYAPEKYLTGRSPLEAASIGVHMKDTDVSFRVNFVTLEGDGIYENLIITDHSSGDITTEESDILLRDIAKVFENENLKFYTGVSYRHCMVIGNGSLEGKFVPPHDILEKRIGDYLPKGDNIGYFVDMMKKSHEILKNHPINRDRISRGLNPANSLWLWGQGTKPNLPIFEKKNGLKAAVISAVDLIKGIAICADMESIDVEGATGTLHTNYEGKAQAAIEAFERGVDYVYLHVEATDECGHQGDIDGKIKAIEYTDRKILKPVFEYLKQCGEDFSILLLPDHKTPIAIRTHSADSVPFVIYRSNQRRQFDEDRKYTELCGSKGVSFSDGPKLSDYFIFNK
ncbi:MAG: cofactor-independent phosphoglycerate mutase [Eubacteriales bacterium]|nr:cofactor-independent phosphoglycerate mutase [Eubacteriales bacterium]MDY3333207.1 cofactor-independent phosphoglycerate mutase [Gallibacter sp.]